MAPFRRLNDAQLDRLGHEELIGHALAARDAGDIPQIELALQMFVYKQEAMVRGFVAGRLDKHGDAVIDQVAGLAFIDAVAAIAAFRGGTPPEARGMVMRIARRRIADFHRKGRVDTVALEWEGEDGEQKSLVPGRPGGQGALEAWSLIEQALAERNELHRRVIELFFFDDLSGEQIVKRINRHEKPEGDDPLTEDNVNQIASRFRKRVKKLLEEAENPEADHG
jgi:DNA-directed RNA polymerase specialized sigma24 family protein